MQALDRTGGFTLAHQAEAALKAAILGRVYRVGEALPGSVELARRFGTSEKTTRTALRRLAADGWVRPVRGVGSVVLARGGERARRGRVLLCYASYHESYYYTQLRFRLERRLVEEGYELLAATTSSWLANADFTDLTRALAERWDLVIENGYAPSVRRMIEKSNHPFISLGSGTRVPVSTAPAAVSTIQVLTGLGLADFYRRAAQLNLHRVWQFAVGKDGFDVTVPLSAQGVKVETFRFASDTSAARVEAFPLEVIRRRLARGDRPDAVVFTDDHFCASGLIALLAHGVRIPDDVRVMTLAVKGDEPVYVRELSRLVMDPTEVADAVARAVLDFTAGRTSVPLTTLGGVWCPGDTF